MTDKISRVPVRPRFLLALALIYVGLIPVAFAQTPPQGPQPPDDSPRITPLVKVIRRIEPAVVGLFTPIGNNQISSGSGSIIHPEGYVLTNNHVLPEPQGFALFQDSKRVRFEVVSRYPESDLAIVRLLDIQPPLATIPIGISSEVINGEPIVVAGNPGGRGLVFTAGIVSAKEVPEGGPNAMVMSNYINDRRERLIQFDAASNKGNSGGPLVNMEGELIGIVSAVIEGEQNIGLAIPIDRANRLAQRMLEPEWAHRKTTRLEFDPLASDLKVLSVASSSIPNEANTAILPGDRIKTANNEPMRNRIDWQLMLETLLPNRDQLTLTVERNGESIQVQWPLESIVGLKTIQAETTQTGIRYEFYEGKFNQMPDFDMLESVRGGVTESFDIAPLAMDRNQDFAVRFVGNAAIESDGLYRIVLVSDDGSKLYINDELFIDNDGNHPAKPSGRIVRLTKGLLPIKVEYFQGNGLMSLFVVIEPCEDRKMINLKDMKLLRGERLRIIP